MPSLIDLIEAAGKQLDYPSAAASFSISGISADSRRVKPGYLFAAIRGEKIDGTQFIPQAKANGATAVLCDRDAAVDSAGLPLIRAAEPRQTLAHMAAAFYARQPEHVVAVTGTDGKTSTVDFFRQLCHGMGRSAASIGTLGILAGDGETLHPGSHTTPDPVELHRLLAEMAEKGTTHVAMEASSHGLDQYRLDGVRLEAAAFTNIARDHLDYHKTEESYFAAKARLFSELLPAGATAVFNADDVKFRVLRKIVAGRNLKMISYGKTGTHYRIENLEPMSYGQMMELSLYGKMHLVDIPLVGAFQAMNILAALGLVEGIGLDPNEAIEVIPRLKGVPGRLEQAAMLANGATVFVDYAHTPMALANILVTLRPHTKGKLHVVFGCGGDRDPGKRPEMGRAAAKLADRVIVTDDNPRGEDPASVRRAVLLGCPGAKEVADRRDAIYVALKALEAGDVLVIAGKGHEKTQIIGSRTLPFDDVEVAREAVRELKL